MSPLLLWEFSRDWTRPQPSKPVRLHGFRAGCSIFPLSPLCLQAEGWQEFQCAALSAFPSKHCAHHWGHLRLNLTQLLPTQLPATADSIPPHSRGCLLCPHQGYGCAGKLFCAKFVFQPQGRYNHCVYFPFHLEWGFQQTLWESITADYGETNTTFVALCGRPQVLFSVAV